MDSNLLPEFRNHISYSDGDKDMTCDQPRPKITEIRGTMGRVHIVVSKSRRD